MRVVWTLAVLFWPLLRFVLAVACVYRLAAMVYFWDTPGTYAGFMFLLHFAGLTAMTYFVSIYKPKGM